MLDVASTAHSYQRLYLIFKTPFVSSVYQECNETKIPDSTPDFSTPCNDLYL